MNLHQYGWDDILDRQFEPYRQSGLEPARISQEHRERYRLVCRHGDLAGEVSGRYRFDITSRAQFPAVGDWVAVQAHENDPLAIIHALLPRRSVFSRKAVLAGGVGYGPGKTEEQVLAANVDYVFLVNGLDLNFNLRRIERYLAIAWDSGAAPVLLLNKADLCDDPSALKREVEAVAAGVPIHILSAVTGDGLEPVRSYLTKGKTTVFLGSSGVGKSTIINALLGEERQWTQEVSESDSRGRHTTTYRELLLLPGAGVLIDTPGVRRLQPWSDDHGLELTFNEVEEVARRCRFKDCQHGGEPGCAVREALENGTLDADRYANWIRLQKEQRHLDRRKNEAAVRQFERSRGKRYRAIAKARKKLRGDGIV